MCILIIASAIKQDASQWTQRIYLWKLLWINCIKKLLFNEMFEKKDLLLLTTKLI